MRQRELKLVITFESTTKAMEMEALCKAYGVRGRLIPIPRTISAGCGMVWCMEKKDKGQLDVLDQLIKIHTYQVIECMV